MNSFNPNKGDFKIRLGGKRRSLSVNAKFYLILDAITKSEELDKINSKNVSKFYGYSYIGVQQWLKRLRYHGLIEIDNIKSGREHIYKLNNKGMKVYDKLSKLYEINENIF